jgi:nucleotide-binding universal stress UspA family protein
MTNTDSAAGGVVVGVDGSEQSWAAVRTAAWEAEHRRQPLTLLHGYFERLPYAAFGRSASAALAQEALAGARDLLAGTAERIREHHPDLPVHTRLFAGGGGSVLVQASREADLIVVGARGHGGFAALSIGSAAAQTAAYAACPVLVVRGRDLTNAATPGPVVVGVDGSPHDAAAIAFAVEEANLRGVPVIGVHVWWFPAEMAVLPMLPNPYQREGLRDAAQLVLAEAMAGSTAGLPADRVEQRVIMAANPSAALIEQSAHAGLVVVGSRGRGGFASLVLGSVSRDLVGHADSPVAVVHQDD